MNGDESGRERAGNGDDKGPVVSKAFMVVGPTLHYSHHNVRVCWLLGVVVFSLVCLFWSKLTTGFFWSPNHLETLFEGRGWHLHRFVLNGIGVFEYPWQILVLGLLMGIFASVPILTAQLLSFSHSLPFIGALLFLANLPGMAFTLVISCIGVACRPLRFRSRIIAFALCMAPLLVYWGYFGSARAQQPIGWGFSFAPWVCAWLVGLIIAGMVLGIGHITRYRPGLIWISTMVTLLAAVGIFEFKIGFDELAFQLYVSDNGPEATSEFHSHSITEVLDNTIMNPEKRQFLSGFFYPTEPIPLREQLKREMQVQLTYDRWPSWIDEDLLPPVLGYQSKRKSLLKQYELFINPPKAWWMPGFLHEQLRKRRSASRRMAIALYYRGLLLEYAPDPRALEQREELAFYSDYPFQQARETWHRLYEGFKASPEALEARWRIAKHTAGLGQFEYAEGLLKEAIQRVQELLEQQTQVPPPPETIFNQFKPPAASVMTRTKLMDLRSRLDRLASLIGPENRGQNPQTNSGLARFVMLNPYALDYPRRLEALLQQLGEKDRLRDNVLLAQAKLEPDQQQRADRLLELHRKYMGSDGGREALFELGLLRMSRYRAESDTEQKKTLLAEARDTLTRYLELYRESIFSVRVEQNLAVLPAVE